MRALFAIQLLLMLSMARAADDLRWPLWDGKETVAEYAKRANLAPTKTLDLGNDVKLELVLIPAGKFMMGTPEPEKPIVGQTMVGISGGIIILAALVLVIKARKQRNPPQFSLLFTLATTVVASFGVWGGVRWNAALNHPDEFPEEHPAHTVTLTKPFYMSKYTVTQEQYQQIIEQDPSDVKGKNNPVENVSGREAQEFCEKLAQISNQAVNLPTEAEWEYSCRAGTQTAYHSGDTDKELERVAWHESNSKGTTHPVGQKEPNTFGLYDMHGNVWQWCQDWYDAKYYSNSPAENPKASAPTGGYRQVIRGGSCSAAPPFCRSAFRFRDYPASTRVFFVGFRIVMPVQP